MKEKEKRKRNAYEKQTKGTIVFANFAVQVAKTKIFATQKPTCFSAQHPNSHKTKFKICDSLLVKLSSNNMLCPLDANCKWQGRPNELGLHGERNHPNLYYTSDNRIRLERLRYREENILFKDEQTYILQFNKTRSYTNRTLKLEACLQFLGDARNKPYNYYQLVLETKEGENVAQFECGIDTFPESARFLKISLKYTSNSQAIYGFQSIESYRIVIKKDFVKVINEVSLNFECPVCFEWMSENIISCENGHSLCTNCASKVDSCPICRVKGNRYKNVVLERTSSLFEKLKLF